MRVSSFRFRHRWHTARSLATVLVVLPLAACGGRETVASRSAAAYADAVEQGLPIEDDHGGDAAVDDHGVPPREEGAHDAAHDPGMVAGAAHDAIGHEDAAHAMAADHGAMAHDPAASPSGAHAGHATVAAGRPDAHAGHSAMTPATADPHAGHTTEPATSDAHAGHSMTTPAAPGAHAGHEGTPHGAGAHAAIPPGGLWGPVTGAAPSTPSVAPPLPVISAPSTSSGLAALRPEATLAPDRADAPAAISVREAQKESTEAPEGHADHPPPEER